jgi:hypothetical protein
MKKIKPNMVEFQLERWRKIWVTNLTFELINEYDVNFALIVKTFLIAVCFLITAIPVEVVDIHHIRVLVQGRPEAVFIQT